MIGAEKWIELIKEYSVPKELTAPLLNAMIAKNPYSQKQQRMRIRKNTGNRDILPIYWKSRLIKRVHIFN